MNRLALCNALISKAGITSGSLVTTVGQVGEAARVVNWIDEAWLNIQMASPAWNWMRTPVSFQTTSGKYSYLPEECGITDFGGWKLDSFRRYVTDTGMRSELHLYNMPYDAWRNTYLFGNMRLTTGDPLFISEGPDLSLNFGLTPGSVGYTVVGEYFRSPASFISDTDTPSMPPQYHMIIVYRAMILYGMYEVATETIQEGQSLYNAMARRLMSNQLVDFSWSGALV